MAKFQELNPYMNRVLELLTGSQRLCKYIAYDTESNEEPLDKPDLTEAERQNLLFQRIFPAIQVSAAEISDAGTFMTVHFDKLESVESTRWRNYALILTIYCRLERWRMPEGLRPYAIMNEIDLLLGDEPSIGTGKIRFTSTKVVPALHDVAGYALEYGITDFG